MQTGSSAPGAELRCPQLRVPPKVIATRPAKPPVEVKVFVRIKGVRKDFSIEREGKRSRPSRKRTIGQIKRVACRNRTIRGARRSVTRGGRQLARTRPRRRDQARDSEKTKVGPDVRGGSEEASACPTTPSACPRRPGEKRRDRVMAPGGAVLRNAMRLLGTEEGLPGGGNGGKRGS